MDRASDGTGMAIAVPSFKDGDVSDDREVGSGAGSDRAIEGAGLGGGAAGACRAGGAGVDGSGVDKGGVVGVTVAERDGASASRERPMRGRGASAAGSAARSAVGARRISFFGGNIRGAGGRLATRLRAALVVGLESTEDGRTCVGPAGGGVELGGGAGFSIRSERTGASLLATKLSATSVRIAEYPLTQIGIDRSAIAAMPTGTASGPRRRPIAVGSRIGITGAGAGVSTGGSDGGLWHPVHSSSAARSGAEHPVAWRQFWPHSEQK